MPNTSAGIHAPARALLFEAPASMMPSTCPVPNFSRSFENFFETAYDIHAAMSAPAPGSAPIAVPSTLPRTTGNGYFFVSPHIPLNTFPILACAISHGWSIAATERMISDTANMPIMIGISVRPPASSALPNVNRGKPAGLSRPTADTKRPSSSETTPFSGLPSARNTALQRPRTTSQKYSNEENLSAISARAGAATISTAVPNSPPITENTSPAPSAISPWPFFVIAYASSVYAADAGVPGIRRKQLGMSPAKIAIAVAVTIDAIAGTGGMKNVTGTSSAVAIVAVRPGTAPTNRPNIAEPRMTHRTYGSMTCMIACDRTEAVIASSS